jgi:hypothetical protein
MVVGREVSAAMRHRGVQLCAASRDHTMALREVVVRSVEEVGALVGLPH